MSVSGIGGGVSHLHGMEGVQASGALGDHSVEQIANTRTEPRGTSIGSAIKSFFKGIGDIFSKLKADFKESRAAERERAAEKKMSKAADAFVTKLANNEAAAMGFFKLDLAVAKHVAPENVARVTVDKLMEALDNLPEDEFNIAASRLAQFDAPGGTADRLNASFSHALDKRAEALVKSGMGAILGTGPGKEDHAAERAAFAQKLEAVGDGLSARFEGAEWV